MLTVSSDNNMTHINYALSLSLCARARVCVCLCGGGGTVQSSQTLRQDEYKLATMLYHLQPLNIVQSTYKLKVILTIRSNVMTILGLLDHLNFETVRQSLCQHTRDHMPTMHCHIPTTKTVFLNCNNWLVFVMEMQCVHMDVGCES
jgi:hypothetical protein